MNFLPIIKKINNHEGALCVAEFKGMPFVPQRMFYVKNVPINTERGNHAHYKTQQLLICLSGTIQVVTHDGYNRHECVLEANDCVHVPAMVWDSQRFLNKEAVLLVLCNTAYSKDDYITDFTEFKRMVREGKKIE